MILSDYSIRFRVAVLVFSVALGGMGIYSYLTIPREGMPDITVPYVFVTASYEGTAPEEVETLITIPLEKQINNVDGVKHIRSSSVEGAAVLTVEFVAGEDIDQAKQKVKDRVDLAKPNLPEDLEEPVVTAFNVSSDFPIFRFALWGNQDAERLRKLAEDLKERIELLPGVKEAEVAGTVEREVRVELNLRRLIAYGISTGHVMQRIAQENATVSAGNIDLIGNKFRVRIPGEFDLTSEIGKILVAQWNGRPVYLRDLADVADTTKDVTSISRVNGKPCVSVSIKKRVGENSVRLIGSVRHVLDEFLIPKGVSLTVVYDESKFVDLMIKELENNIFSGFMLVVGVLFIFMGMRNSLFVAVAIPLSMCIGFVVLKLMGQSLNMIVLFSLVLAVGMLVDNGIVIVENIYRNRSMGLSREEASRLGAGEVAWPVVTSTLTTVVAFAPLLIWPGMMGLFMKFLPKTLIIVIGASLFVGICVNPALCSLLIAGAKPESLDESGVVSHPFVRGYRRMLQGALNHRAAVILLGALALVLSVRLYVLRDMGIELFPETEPRSAAVSIKYPQGTGIDRTDEALRRIEGLLGKYDDVEFYLTTVGGAGGFSFGGNTGGEHIGNIFVQFLDAQKRKGNTLDGVSAIRREIGDVAGAEVRVEKEREGPPTGDPVSIEIAGEDLETLSAVAATVKRRIATTPGLVDLNDDFEEALPELQFEVDRHRAALAGLDTGTIGSFLRTAIFGTEASRFRVDEDEYDITVRLPMEQRSTVSLFDEISMPTAYGSMEPLSSLGRVVYAAGKGAIHRKDQKRMITVSGFNDGRTVDEIIKDVRIRLKGLDLPRGTQISYAGDTQEMEESMEFLSWALLMAAVMIFVILVLQFNSVVLPLVIMISVLMSVMGVMWGLLALHMKFCVIMTGLGIISLAGVVVNNAIVLVACAVQLRSEGLSPREAAIRAGMLRLRPVLLTASTTILGLIPMAVGWSVEIHSFPPRFIAGSETSQWWAPMAVSVIFGLASATVLTLVIVPVMYSVVESLRQRMRRDRRGVEESA